MCQCVSYDEGGTQAWTELTGRFENEKAWSGHLLVLMNRNVSD